MSLKYIYCLSITKLLVIRDKFYKCIKSGKYEYIDINKCVHYCGFRYGREEYNPYETYIKYVYMNKQDIAKKQFIKFLQYYRPKNLGEALGIVLKEQVPLWTYPWDSYNDYDFQKGWLLNPNEVPDIITHFSPKGILRSRIEEEFMWLHNAFNSIKDKGYVPEEYHNYVQVLRLLKENGECAYIVLDGNHRISSLAILGEKRVLAEVVRTVREKEKFVWPDVINGIISKETATNIFEAYFRGNNKYITVDTPAKIIEEN